MYKKLLIIFFVLFSFDSFAIEKKTTFTLDVFNEAQKAGKVIVINSWNKSCGTCARQTKIKFNFINPSDENRWDFFYLILNVLNFFWKDSFGSITHN